MNNFKCHQCGTELMRTAMACRSCGAKTKQPSTVFEKIMLVTALAIFFGLLISAVVVNVPPKPAQDATETAPVTPEPDKDAAP